MHITNLRKVGGSVMVAVPPVFLELLNLRAGSSVGLFIDQGRLVLEATPKKVFSLQQLLEQCDPDAPVSSEEQEWFSGPPHGNELL